MDRSRTYGLAFGTAICAFGIGYIMQFGLALPGASGPATPMQVTAVKDTAAMLPLQGPPLPPRTETQWAEVAALPATGAAMIPLPYPAGAMPPAKLSLASLESPRQAPARPVAAEREAAIAGPGCDVEMSATPLAGAMVRLEIAAPCHAGDRVTLHHGGLTVTETTDSEGALTLDMPALAEAAVFIASFGDAAGAVARTDVSSLPFYDRVVLQWQGGAALELHAREFGAAYFAPGHVWPEAPGSVEAAARGEGGFLTRLGDPDLPEPQLAQVYSFPSGTAKAAGAVALSVEAEIRDGICGTDIAAQTMALHGGAVEDVRDLLLAVPDCDSAGDFMVLKNLIADLKIAAR
ncbi:translocase [Roseivivax sp. CAU 1761]